VFQPSDEALKIVYVDFEMPGPNRFPWTSNGDKDGFQLDPGITGRPNQGHAAQSADRRDEGIPGSQHGPGADPLRRAGTRRLGLDDRSSSKKLARGIPNDPEDRRVSG